MNPSNDQNAAQKMQAMVSPWYQSLQEPIETQEQALQRLVHIYQQTEYGSSHHSQNIGSYDDFQQAFPVMTYEDFQPLIQRVMEGETKFIPMTPTDLSMRVAAGRAVINYTLQTKRFDIFSGVNLNLNFPSKIGTITIGKKEIDYGYSSGIYTKFVSTKTPVRSIPHQDEIDALGGGKTMRDWEARFDLAYEKCINENITLVGGVAPTAIQFGRYMHRKHKRYPRDIWKVVIMTLGSVPGINTRLSASLNALYGNAAIREIYGATEGIFGQQLDEKKAWSPNYDLFFFEIKIGREIKPLYQMKPGELGSLVVSTPLFPRYEIGDLILAFSPPYFRTIGRKDWLTPFKYFWYEFSTLNLGRL